MLLSVRLSCSEFIFREKKHNSKIDILIFLRGKTINGFFGASLFAATSDGGDWGIAGLFICYQSKI